MPHLVNDSLEGSSNAFIEEIGSLSPKKCGHWTLLYKQLWTGQAGFTYANAHYRESPVGKIQLALINRLAPTK